MAEIDSKINDDFKKACKEIEERNAEIERRAKEDAALAIAQERKRRAEQIAKEIAEKGKSILT